MSTTTTIDAAAFATGTRVSRLMANLRAGRTAPGFGQAWRTTTYHPIGRPTIPRVRLTGAPPVVVASEIAADGARYRVWLAGPAAAAYSWEQRRPAAIDAYRYRLNMAAHGATLAVLEHRPTV